MPMDGINHRQEFGIAQPVQTLAIPVIARIAPTDKANHLGNEPQVLSRNSVESDIIA
jgi:hypothetical protein